MDYVQITDNQRQRMLQALGVDSTEALFASLPAEYRLNRPLDLPPAASELELQRLLHRHAAANRPAGQTACFLGCGAYDHFIPSLIDDVASRGEFVTAYTPYQSEASQGALQAFFEFQTQVARLTGLDIANASLYEGATAVAEAAYMALNTTGKRRILLASTLHPHYRQVVRTSLANLPVELIELPGCADTGRILPETVERHLNNDTACLIVQSPNVFGVIEEWDRLFERTHQQDKTLAIAVFNPIAAALLKSPGASGADLAVGEGQPLGIPMGYGGPYLGLFAARQSLLRKMPGRLIGMTDDADGRRGFCLTLQTREQHIRGAKATSNICTNQGLLALRATVYLNALGPQGLREVARHCYHKAHYAATRLSALDGFSLAFPDSPFFHEFVLTCPVPARELCEKGEARGILPGLDLASLDLGPDRQLLVTVTEKRTKQEIDALVDLLEEATR